MNDDPFFSSISEAFVAC